MLVRGRWNVDVRALGMTKTIEFYDFTERSWDEILEKRSSLSFLCEITQEEKTRYLAMYTFPEDVKNRIGSEISSWYYTFPHFTLPFFKNGNFQEEFWKIFEEEPNESPLPPRGERIENPDLIDIFICRYVQTDLEDINLRDYTRRMKEEIGDLIDVQYSTIQKRFHKLKEKNVIYSVNPIDLTEALYTHFFCITSYIQIFRFMEALNRLNIITAISFGKDGRNILYIHGPHNRQHMITRMLTELDSRSHVFSITNLKVNRGLPYKYYLEKYKKDLIG